MKKSKSAKKNQDPKKVIAQLEAKVAELEDLLREVHGEKVGLIRWGETMAGGGYTVPSKHSIKFYTNRGSLENFKVYLIDEKLRISGTEMLVLRLQASNILEIAMENPFKKQEAMTRPRILPGPSPIPEATKESNES